uniref:Uncharacterized protein n=1 Tax=Spermophilus dauricus TaxID=99837 RepID=A0A8C9PEG2_SPEDA
MGTSRIFLCALFLCLTTSPAQGRLHCYTCSFAKPCYPVPTECQDEEACGITVGTSGRSMVHWPLSRWLPTCLLPAFPAAPCLSIPPSSHRPE